MQSPMVGKISKTYKLNPLNVPEKSMRTIGSKKNSLPFLGSPNNSPKAMNSSAYFNENYN